MNRERYERLVELFKTKQYFVDLRTLTLWSNICQYKPHKKKMEPTIKVKHNKKRAYVRVVINTKRYEYEMHEIISVWVGINVIEQKCYFIDGSRLNYHPSNLMWHDKNINPAARGEKCGKHKLTVKDVEEIRMAECPKHNTKIKLLKK